MMITATTQATVNPAIIVPAVANKRKSYNERAAQQMTAIDKVNAKILSGTLVVEDKYEIDSKGRRVRVFTKDAPCTKDDIREVLLNNRVVTEEEILEGVGKNVFGYMLKKGYIRKATNSDYYWITEAGAKAYDLRPVMGCKFPK